MDNSRVHRAWERFLSGIEVRGDVNDSVVASWRRSQGHHVPVSRNVAPVAAEGDFHRHRVRSAALLCAARPVLERSSAFLGEAGSMMILTDATGMVIQTQGDERTIDNGRSIHLERGGVWRERDIGTNAIGTALAVERPVQVHAAEHFCSEIRRWTCAASPIRHPIDDELIGVLDISGLAASFAPQSLAFAVAVSRHIENSLEHSVMVERNRLLQRSLQAMSRWPNEEIMVVDRRGAIVHRTDRALSIARRHRPEIIGEAAVPLLRSIPASEWRDRLADAIPNACIELIAEDGSELGALIVLRQANDRSRLGANARSGSRPAAAPRSADMDRPTDLRRPSAPADFVASDESVARIVRQVEGAAARRMPILIRGETGTGKEQLARHAHVASGRDGAFVPVNCAALPESLIEAELFGYSEGAFTGARRGGAIGLVKEADGGTLFLDEIGDMPISLQAVLLRLLDDWTVRPVGGASSKVDVLLVSATNAKLDQAIVAGRFRADLLYRLNTLEVALPKLSARSDFEAIARHLLAAIDPDRAITAGALSRLAERPWPGHIRELRNVLARATLAADDRIIDEAALAIVADDTGGRAAAQGRFLGLHEAQEAQVLAAYDEAGRNISETARRLRVSRNTIYRILAAHPRK
jgi:transcriptional regulator of acetoin/glycerol metabolism